MFLPLLATFLTSISEHSPPIFTYLVRTSFNICHQLPSLAKVHKYSGTRLELVRYAVRGKAGWTAPRNLLTLLERSRASQATDKRDKLYAYLGLARDDYELLPSYYPHTTVRDVFTKAAKRIVASDSLHILSRAVYYCYAGREAGTLLLPS